ncbi:S1C family serine protease [Acetilactobacillus jinshanensis]|uniref:PDZ domain-containing protein n=1 Tax=Acetilactobacillus jinshanensis TaxID=1720083 RepID=A0A4P6ZM70_9LACO|nr:trypsin-like peptidase domain-containing protein [Acetilactobacillus jinshanensis]QBP18975.1 PDZ domain-containing protein [Acetilactobacillus jinshanensis]URL61959.1 PDZ domain-containing protein [uncultured bacterium]
MKPIHKIIAIAVVAGALGGLVTYGGISYFVNDTNPITQETAVPKGSNKGGTAKVNNVKVNVQTQSEQAFQSVKNDVVSVINLKKGNNNQNPLAQLFGDQDRNRKTLQTNSEGSGVIYKVHNGSAYVVTNNHVIAGSNQIEVLMSNGKRMQAKLVGHDKVTDLAVLKINANQVHQVATFGNSNNIKVGETALAIGSPLGSSYASSLTQGIISAKKREVPRVSSNGMSFGDANVIQTDTAINPGNSGGPLINLGGQVIGINSMKMASDGQGATIEGMGFAIPSNEVTRVINQIVKHGRVIRPRLGILYTDLANISAKQRQSVLKLPKNVNQGSVIMDVKPGSAAQKAGLKKYDVITKMAGQQIHGLAQLRDILYAHKIGQRISITYYQGGHVHQTTVKLVP